MNLWLENGEVKSDDPDGAFHALSLGHDLYTYSVVGFLLAFVCHERFSDDATWRIPTDTEKLIFRKYRKFDVLAVIGFGGWRAMEVKGKDNV